MSVDDYINQNMDSGPASIEDIRGVAKGLGSINQYDLVKNAYHGTGGFRDGDYLTKHPRERDFEERQGYSFYLNYFRPIIDSLVNPVFKTPSEREYGENELFRLFESNCNRGGIPLNQFMKQISKIVKRDGSGFIVMDSQSDIPTNLRDTIEKRAVPYVYFKKASEVIWYKLSKFKQLEEIAFSEEAEDIEKGKETAIQYRKWFKGGWEVYKKFEDGELKEMIESGVTPNNLFPVIPFLVSQPEDAVLLPTPPLYDIAKINASIYNLWSELREIQRKQGFSILTIPGKPNSKTMESGTGSALFFPEEARHEPKYIQPEVDVQRGYLEAIKMLVEDMFKQAKLGGVTGIIQQTGVAKQWDFQATDTELQDLARQLEWLEMELAFMFQQWTGTSFEFDIAYPEDYGVIDLDADIDRAEKFMDQGMTPEVNKEVKKGLIRGYFSDKRPEEIEELESTIDNMSEDENQSNIQDEDLEKDNG